MFKKVFSGVESERAKSPEDSSMHAMQVLMFIWMQGMVIIDTCNIAINLHYCNQYVAIFISSVK